MKRDMCEASGLRTPRFHIARRDGLYGPIRFLFVTERMCQDILAERQEILAVLSATEQKRQLSLFNRYDPQTSASAFKALLGIFKFASHPAPAVAHPTQTPIPASRELSFSTPASNQPLSGNRPAFRR